MKKKSSRDMPKTSRTKPTQKAGRTRARRQTRHARLVKFPQAKGRTVEWEPEGPQTLARGSQPRDVNDVIRAGLRAILHPNPRKA
jgi:hypothetical protein